ncbi:glycosyltransferase family 39 protein [Patescibacteria group bacterium]
MQNKLKTLNPLIIIFILSFLVRLIGANQSLWLDEAAQAIESARPFSEQLDIIHDFQPPLFHYIVHFFHQVSSADWWLRLASIIPGVLTIVFAYKIAEELFNKKAALITGILGAISPYHYYFSQELRPYSLATMAGTMSMYYFFKLTKSKSKKVNLGYIISTAVGLYSTYVFPFILAAQLLIVIYSFSKKIKEFSQNLSLSVLVFIPWVPTFARQLSAGIGLKNSYAGWATAVSLPWQKSLPLTGIRFIIGMIQVDFTVVQIIFFSLILGVLARIIFSVLSSKKVKHMLIWLIVPVMVSFLVSFFIPVLEPKRVMYVLPALWITLGISLSNTKNKFSMFFIFLLSIIPLFIHFTNPKLQRENWKQAVSFVEKSSDLDTGAVFAFPEPFAPWLWYKNDLVAEYPTKTLIVNDHKYLDENIKGALTHENLFVFEYLMGLSDPQRKIFSWIELNGYTKVEIKDFHGVGFIHIYQKQKPFALR